MIIAIPVNEDQKTICQSFGRTPFFALWNSQNQEVQYVDNSAAASQGGAGIKAAQLLLDKGVEAILTPRLGENAAQVFQAANVLLYKTDGDNLQDNLTAFQAKRLEQLTDIHPGFHGHGGN